MKSEIGLGTALCVLGRALQPLLPLVSHNLLHVLKRQFNLEQEPRCRPALLRRSASAKQIKSGSRGGSVKMRLDWLDKKEVNFLSKWSTCKEVLETRAGVLSGTQDFGKRQDEPVDLYASSIIKVFEYLSKGDGQAMLSSG